MVARHGGQTASLDMSCVSAQRESSVGSSIIFSCMLLTLMAFDIVQNSNFCRRHFAKYISISSWTNTNHPPTTSPIPPAPAQAGQPAVMCMFLSMYIICYRKDGHCVVVVLGSEQRILIIVKFEIFY